MDNKIRLLGLKIINAGLIEILDINFDENGIVIFAGDNRQGKTTITKALNILFYGKRVLPTDYMMHNKNRMEITGRFNNCTITRTKTATGELRVTITDSNGKPVKQAPETFIKKFINELTLNPKPFIDQTGSEIYNYLVKFANIDTTTIDKEISELETTRLDVGRDIERHGKPKKVAKIEHVDISEIVSFNEEQDERKSNLEKAQIAIDNLSTKAIEIGNEIHYLESKLSEKRIELGNINYRINNGKNYIINLPQPEQKKPVQNLIEQNRKADAYQQYVKDDKEYQKLSDDYARLNSEIKNLRIKKDDMFHIDNIIPGLKLTPDGAYLNDIHADNWSDEERFGVFIKIWKKVNPDLRLLYFDNAEKIGRSMMEHYRIIAEQNDFLAILTQVRDYPDDISKEPGVFYIKAGSLLK